MVPVPYDLLLMLQRRGAISFEKTDTTAVYVRQLGDVRIQSQQDRLHKYILNNLHIADRNILERLASPTYKTRCGNKFSTLSGMRRRRRCLLKPGVDSGQSLVDDFYKSATKCLLNKTSDWSFDVFALDQLSNGKPLFYIILKLFQEHNLIEHFSLDIVKLMKFATLVEDGYHQNPYHNAVHAADVTQAMHCYIMQEKIARHLSPLETMIALVSAITHDLDHPGVNQAFLIATSNPLASLYKQSSVLENHHFRSAVGILHESGLFDHLPSPMRKNIIKQMKSLILATDMTLQVEFLEKLRERVLAKDLDMTKPDDKHFILQIALKCADINNPCRSWPTCKAWSNRVCTEFFQQGDYESKLNLPITNLCDRFTNSIPRIQTGFMGFVVEPLFTEFAKFMPCNLMSEQLDNMRSNRQRWEIMSKERIVTVDINSNLESSEWYGSDADSGSESDEFSLPTSATCSTQSELDDTPADIGYVQSNIALVAERIAADRRPSLPSSKVSSVFKEPCYGRRESYPRIHDNRKTCIPHNSLIPHAISFDQLVEKLTSMETDFTSVNSSVNLDNLRCEPRLSTLSPNIETSKITNYLLTKRLVSK